MKKITAVTSLLFLCAVIWVSGCSRDTFYKEEIPAVLVLGESSVKEDEKLLLKTGSETEAETVQETENPGKQKLLESLPEELGQPFLDWLEQEYSKEAVQQLWEAAEGGTLKDADFYKATSRTLTVLKDEFYGLLETEETAVQNNIYVHQAKQKDEVTLSFAGDVSFAEGYANMSAYYSRGGLEDCISPDLFDLMDQSDIMMLNHEYASSDRGSPLSGKSFTFRAKPSMTENLHKMSVDLVSVANNHVYDYGETAFLDTLNTLKAAGIPYAGGGANLEEAASPVYFIADGIKIAVVSATQIERSKVYTKEAGADSPGVMRTFEPARFLKVIENAKSQSDFVIAFVHWGTEGTSSFGQDQQSLGYQFINAGADLVVGAHPHVLQGIEYYKGKPIVYSLGNFWFNSKTIDTGILQAKLDVNGLKSLSFVPCIQKNSRTVLAESQVEKERIWNLIEKVSRRAEIDAEGVITEKAF